MVAVFMTSIFMLIKLPDFKNFQIRLYALYFLGIFVLYYLLDELNNLNRKKKSLNKNIK
ncbi:hypothetical protein BCF50_3201 [Chryseobacterium daecheongense]|nr:hypothetical protein BCF50_3201 [Chryseobacterium daecheongense]